MAHASWSELMVCPDCDQETLRVFFAQYDDEPPRRTDEFCDNPGCTHGDVAEKSG
jgi:hypothetical protein